MKSFLLRGKKPIIKWGMLPNETYFEGNTPEGFSLAVVPSEGYIVVDVDRHGDEDGFNHIPFSLEEELKNDPKEIAEHLMLIDLGRNDVGRVAQPGTVTVTEKFMIERYSHVMHICSNVEGMLKPGKSAMDVLRATLPVGTLSGAPKVRAMEIIDELEPVKRGIYGGAVGYLAWNGNMDTAIAIRTAVVKDGKLYIEAGGGIVHDSIPRLEWKESLNKGRAIFRAAAMAENKLINPAP